MEDLISRQAAIDVLAEMQGRCTSKAALIQNSKIWQQIKDLPSAQPEIVRCKDCKHRHLDDMIWNCPFGLPGGEDFFCAYGAKGGDKE